MKINYWLNAGFAARGDERPSADNVSDWLVWLPVGVNELTTAPIGGDSGSIDFYLAPKKSALHTSAFGGDVVLIGVPLGDIDYEAEPLLSDVENAVVQVPAPLPMEKIQVVAGLERATTERAEEVLRTVPSDFEGERQFHTIPQLFHELD